NALPEIDFNKIDLSTSFLDKTLQAPFLVSSMTGGSDLATKINTHFALAREEKKWAIGLGSTRALLESDAHASLFLIRDEAKSVPLVEHIEAVQFNYGYGLEE